MRRLWQSGSAALFVGLAIVAAAAPAPKKRPLPGSYTPYPTTIAVSNFPATQPVSGSVSVSNFPASQAVTGTFWQATQPVSGTFWQATQPVSGTFWQATQPISGSVSVSNFPASQAVTGTFWQATQPVSGTFWQATQPVSGTVTANQGGTWTVQPGNTANTTAWKVDGSAVTQPVSGTFWQATQPVSGTFWQATQPVSGTVAATQSGTWTVQPGNTANTTAWKVDGSAVTQPVSGAFWQATQPVSGTVTVTPPTLTKGTQGATGFSTQDLKDAGRSSIMITAEAVAGATSEALVTMTWSAGGAATTTGTSYPVTSGKRLRLQSMTVTWIATTTTANTTRIRLRENASGSAIITSPLQWSARIGWPSAVFIANEAQSQTIAFPDGFELPGGAGLAISHIEAAANGTIDLSLTAYEF